MAYQYIYSKSKENISGWKNSSLFNLSIPIDSDWVEAISSKSKKLPKNRALVIIESVPSEDLPKSRAKTDGPKSKLLSGGDTRDILLNILDESVKHAKSYDYTISSKWRFGFLNFNFAYWYNVKDPNKIKDAHNKARRRVLQYIKQLKPNLVIVLGRTATDVLSEGEVDRYDNGKLFKIGSTPAVSTMAVDLLTMDGREGRFISLAGRMIREIANGILGRNPHDLSHLEPKYEYVDTPAKFNRMMKDLYAAEDGIGYDIETSGLNTYSNSILTMQFCPNDTAYVLPIHHKDTPWRPKQLKHIRSQLRKFFAQAHDWYSGFLDGEHCKYLIAQNAGFDMRITQRWLNIPYCQWPIWDIMGGEHALDENISLMKTNKVGYRKIQKLDGIFASYGNNFYTTAEFSKQHREIIVDVNMTDDVIAYCAMDAQAVQAIHKEQIARAEAVGYNSFKKFMLLQVSSMVRSSYIMESRGTRIDVNYLISTLEPGSPVTGLIDSITKEINSTPEVQEAMEGMLASTSSSGRRTVLDDINNFTPKFDPGKATHQKALFEDTLKLKPLRLTKKTKKPSYDSKFLDHYADKHESIGKLAELRKVEKLKGTYIEAFYRHIEKDQDAKNDHRLRARFGYADTITGRSNSSNPSFQQIPEHGDMAKIIKRSLITPPRTLHYEADYSAHEVRMWGVLSEDKNLASTMASAHKYIVQYRKDPSDKNFKLFKERGDIHKQSYSFFTGTSIGDITSDQRQDSKGITFGRIYGMGLDSMSISIKKSLEETKEIVGRFTNRYKTGHEWLDEKVFYAEKNLYTESPLGRRRNLQGYVTPNRAIREALARKAKNSEIQGFASDTCFKSADIFARELDKCLDELGESRAVHTSKIGLDMNGTDYLLPGPNAIVHDSIKGEAKWEHYMLHIHLLEWSMTNGLKDFLKNYYQFTTDIPFDIEFDIGSSWADKQTWDWSTRSFNNLVYRALKSHIKTYGLDDDPKQVLKMMKGEYKEQCKALNLHDRYPLNLE